MFPKRQDQLARFAEQPFKQGSNACACNAFTYYLTRVENACVNVTMLTRQTRPKVFHNFHFLFSNLMTYCSAMSRKLSLPLKRSFTLIWSKTIWLFRKAFTALSSKKWVRFGAKSVWTWNIFLQKNEDDPLEAIHEEDEDFSWRENIFWFFSAPILLQTKLAAPFLPNLTKINISKWTFSGH